MKRSILLVVAVCLSILSYAQKAPKKSFSTENNPNVIQWQNGAQVNLSDGFEGKGIVYSAEVAEDKTYFWGRGAGRTEEGNWLAIYPASALRTWEDNILYFNIPHEQIANNVEAPMYSRTTDSELNFRPLTAYLTFTLAPDVPPIKEIRLTTTKYISGSYKIDLSVKNPGVALDTGDRYREIILKPQNGGVILPGDYTMAIFARVLPDGMTMEIVTEDGQVAVKKIAREIKLTLGKTRDLGVLTNLGFGNKDSQSSVGTPYKNEGVVFWVDPSDESRGKAVAAMAEVMKWAEKDEIHGIHTFKENYEKVHSTVLALPAYQENPDNYKAVCACEKMRQTYGGNWHVPSATEMKYLFNAYYGKTNQPLPENGVIYTDAQSVASSSRFDAQLEAIGGEKMFAKTSHYWICGQNSNGRMQYINMKSFHNGNDVQTAEKYVRCVRDFNTNSEDGNSVFPITEAGKVIKAGASPKIADIVWDTTFTVTKGLEYYQMQILTDTYDKMDMYLLRVDQSQGLDVRAATSGNANPPTWVRQIPSEMAAHMDSPEKPLYALVNADFCENRPPIRPRGPHHADGKIIVSSYSIDPKLPQQALSYVGVTFEGKMVIGYNAEYQAAKKTLKECTGAGVIMLKDYEIQGGYVNDPDRDPRTALGYTADNIVWILAVDGRHKGTEGMTYMEMATIFKALGCVDAVNLDGGGSTQMLVRNPQTDKIEMRNWPSDPTAGFGGRERARLNGWVVMKR